jgi:CSLREA domain-containing protein
MAGLLAIGSLGAPNALAEQPSASQTSGPADVTPAVNFSASLYRASELSSSAPLTVTLSAASAVTATVDYASTPGSAQTGTDYSTVSGTLTFSPGVTSQIINLPILDDNLTEGDEMLTVTLSSPVNATLGLTTTALLAISDDETTAFTVTKGTDTNDGACETTDCSLREAVIAANAYPGANSIDLPAGVYTLSLAGANEDAAATGDLDLTDDVQITGVTSATSIISGTYAAFDDRLFEIASSATVTICNVGLTGGMLPNWQPGDPGGGAVFNAGNLTLSASQVYSNFAGQGGGLYSSISATLAISLTHFTNNLATDRGGGVMTLGPASVYSSTFTGNTALNGGGLASGSDPNWSPGVQPVTIVASLFVSNTAVTNTSPLSGFGGGVYVNGVMTLTNSLLTGNHAGDIGGGLSNLIYSRLFVRDSAFTSNTSGFAGGGLTNQGTLDMADSSVTLNHADFDGGGLASGNTLTLTRVLVAENSADVYGGGLFVGGFAPSNAIQNSAIMSNTAPDGAGIYNIGNLTLTTVSLISNTAATGSGGGIYSNGGLVVTNSAFIGNWSSGTGGGLAAYAPAQILSSTFSLNQSFEGGGLSSATGIDMPGSTVIGSYFDHNIGQQGGGLHTSGNITITHSNFNNNVATICGGGIEVWPITIITASTFISNTAPKGGGICATGQTWLYDSFVTSNTATSHGGGIEVEQLLHMERTSVSGNVAGSDGGGIYSPDGALWLADSVVAGNSATSASPAAGNGGGIYVTQFMIALDSTLSGNTATGNGGGLYSGGYTSFVRTNILNNLTIADNVADQDNNGSGNGGGVYVVLTSTLKMTNTLIAGNQDLGGQAPDCFGTVTSSGYNLIESTLGCTISGTATGNITGQSAQLGPLADNGGPTLTHALLSGSPALDTGSPVTPGSGGSACEAADQRGIARPQGFACDIGAYELVITPTVQFSSMTYSAHEHSGAAPITVTLNAPWPMTVTVTYSSSDGTALAGQDYVAASGVLTFTPGQTTQVFTITLLPDGVADPGETISLTLSDAVNATLGAPVTATLTLADAQVRLSSAAATVSEAGPAASLPVLLDVAAGYTLTVDYALSDGSAAAGSDYLAGGGTLTFTPGMTQTILSVPIVSDTAHEVDETFGVALGSPAGATLTAPMTATVTIQDDDPLPGVRFSSSNYTVTESSASAVLTITLTAGSELTATVLFTTSQGTAQSGDFVESSGTLTFTPGLTQTLISIPILSDSLPEAAETFGVTLGSPVGASLATPATATVTIQDDDPLPGVSFSASAYTVTETAGSVIITASLTAASSLTATVQFATSDDTAAAGSDYVSTGGTLTFTPGITQSILSVPIVSDSLHEGPETFNLALTNPVGANLAAPSTTTVTILDTDPAPAVTFSSSAYTVGENAGSAVITVSLSAPSALTATVGYSASGGTATAGADFASTSGTLTFAPGQEHLTFTVVITDDALLEGNETILLTLFGPTGATLSAPSTATLTIRDDEVEYRIQLPLIMRS